MVHSISNPWGHNNQRKKIEKTSITFHSIYSLFGHFGAMQPASKLGPTTTSATGNK
ncbi:hypothetical protein DERF_005842 [Dermatophagoides farinae]|uniref:Uncharacterized protein n=1 Tax=Dermatophagoides farinae TaxID=6954 RepID=A0A922I938_DERFA|nr:hypothetical protein DERF_005842 [Dermatophagoides farinae]